MTRMTLAAALSAGQLTPAGAQSDAGSAAVMQLAAGSVPDMLESVEAGLSPRADRSTLRAITELGFRYRGTGPALRASSDDPGILLLVYMAARDTARVRGAIVALDSARARLAFRNLPPPVTLAEAELFLGDTAAAYQRLSAFASAWTDMEKTVSWGAVQNGWLLGRTWLLLGDVAEALGHHEQAAVAYRRADARPGAAADNPGARVNLGAAPARDEARVRYDAVLWMQPRVGGDGAERPLATLGFVATERLRATTAGRAATQRYDSVSVEAPLLSSLGGDGLAMRRAIQSASGTLAAVTECDARGGSVARRLEGADALPGEFRQLLERGAGFGPLATALRLPDAEVRVGDTWTDSVTIGLPGADAPVTMAVTWRLTRLHRVGGRRLAFVSMEGRHADATARATLTGEVVRDVDQGINLRLAASLEARLTSGAGVVPVRVLLTALRETGTEPAALAMRE